MLMSWKTVLIIFIVTVVYLMIGAVIFRAIEQNREKDRRAVAAANFEQFLLDNTCMTRDEAVQLLMTMGPAYVNGDLLLGDHTDDTNWNFWNSVFFCLSIVTTIGYGHVTPTTTGGKIFCIFYAIIGIPLFLITLAGIGMLLNAGINFIRRRIPRCDSCCAPKWQRIVSTLIIIVLGLIIFIFLPAVMFDCVEDGWNYLDALYFCFITLLTIGFGDYVAGWPTDINTKNHQGWYRCLTFLWICFGLAWVAGFVAACVDTYLSFVNKTEDAALRLEEKVWEKMEDEKSDLEVKVHHHNNHDGRVSRATRDGVESRQSRDNHRRNSSGAKTIEGDAASTKSLEREIEEAQQQAEEEVRARYMREKQAEELREKALQEKRDKARRMNEYSPTRRSPTKKDSSNSVRHHWVP